MHYRMPLFDRYLVHAPLHEVSAVLSDDDLRQVCECRPLADAELDRIRSLLRRQPRHHPQVACGPFQPESLAIVTTRSCNLRCTYCYFDADGQDERHVDVDCCISMVDWMMEKAIAHGATELPIHFFGGEPFQAFEVIEAVVTHCERRCREAGIRPVLTATTNGLLAEPRARWVADHLHGLVLSLDGSREIHNRNRSTASGKGSFAAAARTADIMVARGVPLRLRACVTAASVSRMSPMAVWMARRWRPASIKFEPLTVNAASRTAGLQPPDPFDFARQWYAAYGRTAPLNISLVYHPVNPGQPRLSSCLVGHDVAVLHPDGGIHACYLDPVHWVRQNQDLSLGHVDAGNHVLVNPARVQAVRDTVADKPGCTGCFCRFSCAGGCHVTHRQQGNIRAYDDFCLATRTISACLMLDRMGAAEVARKLLGDTRSLSRLAFQEDDRFALPRHG